MPSIKILRARALSVVLPVVVGGLVLASSAGADGGHRYSIRVTNSGAGGDPGYFYVGGPLNVTVTDRLGKHAALRLCMTPAPIDRPSCHDGSVGRTIDSLAPSKAGLTRLRVRIGQTVLVRVIRVRKPASASAASGRLVGKRLKVKVKQLLIYAKAGQGSYIGSLIKGQSFKVRRLSRSGRWAYGVAYGTHTRLGWVRTSGLTGSTRTTRIGQRGIGAALAARSVTLTLQRSYVGGIYPRELARGTVRLVPPQRWTFVRYSTVGHSKALYTIPASGAACVPQGEVRVVGVQATGADPLAVARDHAFKGVIASGRLRSGAWAVVRYRTAPSSIKAMLGGVTVLRVAPRRLLTIQTRLRTTCPLTSGDLDHIATELGTTARSAQARVRVEVNH